MKPVANYTPKQMEEIMEFIAEKYEGEIYRPRNRKRIRTHRRVYCRR